MGVFSRQSYQCAAPPHNSCERRDFARGKECRSPGCTREVHALLVYQIEVLDDVVRRTDQQDFSDGKNADRSLLHPERVVSQMPVLSATKTVASVVVKSKTRQS